MYGGTTVMFLCAQEVGTFQEHILDYVYLVPQWETSQILTSLRHPIEEQLVNAYQFPGSCDILVHSFCNFIFFPVNELTDHSVYIWQDQDFH